MRVFDLEQPRTTEMPIHPAHRQAGYSYLLLLARSEIYNRGTSFVGGG